MNWLCNKRKRKKKKNRVAHQQHGQGSDCLIKNNLFSYLFLFHNQGEKKEEKGRERRRKRKTVLIYSETTEWKKRRRKGVDDDERVVKDDVSSSRPLPVITPAHICFVAGYTTKKNFFFLLLPTIADWLF